jgi:hypothetical protein
MPTRSRFPGARLCGGCFRAILVGASALLAAAPAAQAQITALQKVPTAETEEELHYPFVVVGVSMLGGLAKYDMKQMNSALRIINNDIAGQGSLGIRYDPLNKGASLGGQIRAIVADRIVLTTSYERLIASSHVGGVTSESKIGIPADAVEGTLGYDLLSAPHVRLGFGLGLGWYRSRADQVITETLASQDTHQLGRIELKGSTVSPHYEMFFETRFTDHLYVGLSGGYRSAKIDNIDITGLDKLEPPRSHTAFISVPVAQVDPTDSTHVELQGGGTTLDWSGLYGKFTMTYYVNMPTLF